jgi:hypothetical protein
MDRPVVAATQPGIPQSPYSSGDAIRQTKITMKTAVLASFLASAAAFAPASNNGMWSVDPATVDYVLLGNRFEFAQCNVPMEFVSGRFFVLPGDCPPKKARLTVSDSFL